MVARYVGPLAASGSAHAVRWRRCRGNGDDMYYVYFIKSFKNGSLYIGSTEDLKKRLAEHNIGKTKSTKPFCLWRVVYYEAHLNKKLARQAEMFYKGGQGRRQVKKKLGIE